jgi:hypothetical protein
MAARLGKVGMTFFSLLQFPAKLAGTHKTPG